MWGEDGRKERREERGEREREGGREKERGKGRERERGGKRERERDGSGRKRGGRRRGMKRSGDVHINLRGSHVKWFELPPPLPHNNFLLEIICRCWRSLLPSDRRSPFTDHSSDRGEGDRQTERDR